MVGREGGRGEERKVSGREGVGEGGRGEEREVSGRE